MFEAWRLRERLSSNPCFLYGLGSHPHRNHGIRGLFDHAQMVLFDLDCSLGTPGGPFNLAQTYRFNLIVGETADEVVENAIGDIVHEARVEALRSRFDKADDAVVALADAIRSLVTVTDRDQLRSLRTRLVAAIRTASLFGDGAAPPVEESEHAAERGAPPAVVDDEPTDPAADPEGAAAGSEVIPLRKPKRSTVAGEARDRLIAKLTEHHRYADDSCLHDTAIGNNEVARAVGVSRSTASAFFKEVFGGWRQYRVMCGRKETLIAALKLLNGEFTPRSLLRADVAG